MKKIIDMQRLADEINKLTEISFDWEYKSIEIGKMLITSDGYEQEFLITLTNKENTILVEIYALALICCGWIRIKSVKNITNIKK